MQTNATPQILVVEDSEPQALALRRFLESSGFGVATAANGKLALGQLADRKFDLVVTDIEMQEMNGLDLSKSIKADPALRSIPVLLLSRFASPDHLLDGIDARADCYVTKPFEPAHLLQHVRALLKPASPTSPPPAEHTLTVQLQGRDRQVTATPTQLLTFLLSTYEGALHQNDQLTRAQDQLQQRNQELRSQGHRLKASERNLQALLENKVEGVVVIDQKGLVRFVNPAAQTLLQKPELQLIDKPFPFTIVPDETREVTVPISGGELIIAELHVADTVWEGELAYVASLRDITQRKQDEQRLVKTQALLDERNQKLQEQGHRLRVSERNYRALLENNVDGMLVIDESNAVWFANPAAEILLQKSAADLRQQPFPHPLTLDAPSEIELTDGAGENVIAEMRVTDTVWEDKPAFLVTLQDITERKQNELKLIKVQQALRDQNLKLREQDRRLRTSEKNFRTLLENSADGIIVVDQKKIVRFVTPSAVVLLGKAGGELLGKPFEFPLVPDETREIEISMGDQTTIAELHGVDTVWEGESAFLASIRDITQRKQDERKIQEQQAQLEEANAQLQALAISDGLTGLKNHRAFKAKINEEFQRANRFQLPLSLLLLDVDHFKPFNDTFGHPAGDEVLRRVARLLEENARTTDLVARYGGEEFVVILPYTDQDETVLAGERFREIIASADWDKRAITASFGAATLLPTMGDAAELIAAADAALYMSKQNGRNRVTHAANPP
jgi:diguanylate cyclase (GGDEF)-like protein